MNCCELEVLSRYQDGSLDEAESRLIAEHLEGCATCREKLRSLGHAGLFFRIALSGRKSAECLGDETLGAYLSGALSRDDRRRVEDHLLSCRKCLHEVAALSDEQAPSADSPVPDARAMARFSKIAPRPAVRRPAFAWASHWGLRAAAAVVLAAVAVGWVEYARMDRAATVAAGELRGGAGPYIAEVSLTSETMLAPSGSTELARFAREAGVVLREIERRSERPRTDSFVLVQQDILNSGLVESISRLSEFVPEGRDRKFLADCEDVLMAVVKADGRDLDSPDGSLAQIVSQIRRLDLIETARLVEMEGSRSQWLAGL
jgi:anti-sigma factor RsiW